MQSPPASRHFLPLRNEFLNIHLTVEALGYFLLRNRLIETSFTFQWSHEVRHLLKLEFWQSQKLVGAGEEEWQYESGLVRAGAGWQGGAGVWLHRINSDSSTTLDPQANIGERPANTYKSRSSPH